MPTVEEIGNHYNKDVYFTSSINLPSKSKTSNKVSKGSDNRRKRLAPGSYNLANLETNLTDIPESTIEFKKDLKRFNELDKENYNDTRIELPKNFTFDYKSNISPVSLSSNKARGMNSKVTIKQSYLTSVRKILTSKKTINNYLDELDEKNNSIINNSIITKKNQLNNSILVPHKKLCSICGDSSPGSCTRCNLRVCSVKCFVVHNEARCPGYYG